MTLQRPVLSICIPTYNFGEMIGETLDSIIDQLVDDAVEIVVLDSASTDDTAQVVAARTDRCTALRYVRVDAKSGIDIDMAQVVALATAEMIWLFSADDLMRPGALAKVVTMATNDPGDVIVISHSNCTIDMQILIPHHPVMTGPSRRIAITDADSRARYFAAAETTEAFFSFMSGLVIRRTTWDRLADAEMFVGSCWSHAARLLAGMTRGDFTVSYVADVMIDRRGDNDSFGSGGVVRRYALAIDGYTAIISSLFGADSIESKHIRRVLRREFGLVMFMLARRRCLENPAREDREFLDRLFATIYIDDPRGWYRRPIYRLAPPTAFLAAFNAARRVYHLVR